MKTNEPRILNRGQKSYIGFKISFITSVLFLTINSLNAQILDPCTNNYADLPPQALIVPNTIYELNNSYTLTSNTTFNTNEIVVKNPNAQIIIPTSEIRLLQEIKEAIQIQDYSEAHNLINSFLPKTTIHLNYIQYYTLLLKHREGIIPLDPTDMHQLIQLAALCPHTDGLCVYEARILLNTINVGNGISYKSFTDVCTLEPAYKKSNIDTKNNFDVEIYPNPNANSFKLIANKNGIFKINILDALGKNYAFTKLELSNAETKVNTNLPSGLYFVTIINSSNEKVTKKLCIN